MENDKTTGGPDLHKHYDHCHVTDCSLCLAYEKAWRDRMGLPTNKRA